MRELTTNEVDAVAGADKVSDQIGEAILLGGLATANPAILLLGALWFVVP